MLIKKCAGKNYKSQSASSVLLGVSVLFFALFILSAFLISTLKAQDTSTTYSYEAYIVKKGDTLWNISNNKLKDPFLWSTIWKENPDIKNSDLIYPGDRIKIPFKRIITPVYPVLEVHEEEATVAEIAEPGILEETIIIPPNSPFSNQKPLELPLSIILNKEDKGDFFVFKENGDFLIKTDDLKEMGITGSEGRTTLIDGKEYMSLKSMAGVDFTFNEKDISLDIIADPRLFEKTILTMQYPGRSDVIFTRDSSAFLNYNAAYYPGSSTNPETFTLTNQIGARAGDILLLSDLSYTKNPDSERFVRLMSNITQDDRKRLNRTVFGDFFGLSGELGSQLNMGGISLSKNYRIDPYFIQYPEISFTGLVSLPSELEIYRDGILINRERLSPGEFELKDIPAHVGSGTIEVVLKDPFGRQQRITEPYYFTDKLLKRGLQEFSYNLGFLRESFGTKSNEYSDLAFLGFHRFGINDSFTSGIRAEAKNRLVNFGFLTTMLLRPVGVIDISAALSNSKAEGSGLAGSISYLYQRRRLSFNLFLKGFSEDYSNISMESQEEKTEYEMAVGSGYAAERLGSLSLTYSEAKKYQGTDSKKIATAYSRQITDNSSLHVTMQRDMATEINEFFAGFNYYFRQGITGSATYRTEDTTSARRIQVLKNLPGSEGAGYRAYYERRDDAAGNVDKYYAMLQYNAGYGHYTGEFTGADEDRRYSFSASGSLSYIENSLNLSRPIQDSFALVKTGKLKGVRVYLSNQEIGRTDASGKVLIPDLGSYYNNQISIDDKDIPIDYSISGVTKYISPPFRSGAYVEFDIKKFQAVTGRLNIKIDGEVKPVEYRDASFFLKDKEISFPTGRDGEFYLENIKPGKYGAGVNYMGKDCFFDIIIPESEEILIDLGEVICE